MFGDQSKRLRGLVAIVVVVPVAVPIMIFAVAMIIAIPVAIPPVIVGKPAVLAFPITLEPTAAIMMGRHPYRSRVRGSTPIAFMPDVTAIYRIPVAVHPNKIGSRSPRTNRQDVWRRRWTDVDPYGKIHSKR